MSRTQPLDTSNRTVMSASKCHQRRVCYFTAHSFCQLMNDFLYPLFVGSEQTSAPPLPASITAASCSTTRVTPKKRTCKKGLATDDNHLITAPFTGSFAVTSCHCEGGGNPALGPDVTRCPREVNVTFARAEVTFTYTFGLWL